MKKEDIKYLATYIVVMIVAAGGLYTLSLYLDFMNERFIYRASLVYTFVILSALFWYMASIHRKVSQLSLEIAEKYTDTERLLVDVRDGTKRFYKEKRKSERVKAPSALNARVADKDIDKLLKVLDLSPEGALLRASRNFFKQGETVYLNMNLPYFVQPIDVKAKIVRIDTLSKGKDPACEVGIEYLNMTRSDRDKLKETLDILENPRPEEKISS
jgi:hypothetical protein